MTPTKKLGDVFDIRKGKKATAVADTPIAGSFPYIQIDEVRGAKPTKFAIDLKPVLVTEDDVCIVWDGANAGTIGYGVAGAVGSTVARMRLKDRSEWEPRFLGRLLEGRFPQLNQEAQARGATIPHVDKARLEAIEFPRFAPNVQRRIADALDKAASIRCKRNEVFALVDSLRQSVFLRLFGDPATNPKSFPVEPVRLHLNKGRQGVQSGPFGAALKKHEYKNVGVPVWGVENVQSNCFVDSPRMFISSDKYRELERYNVKSGDVLISRAGTVGRMCIATPSASHSIISTNLTRVSLDDATLTPEYFVHLFSYFSDRLAPLKANNKEDAFTFLNPSTLKSLNIPIPPMDLQLRYRNFTNLADATTLQLDEHSGGLATLFASLAQRALLGEL